MKGLLHHDIFVKHDCKQLNIHIENETMAFCLAENMTEFHVNAFVDINTGKLTGQQQNDGI